MTPSCLNRTLIYNSVAGTGANVTLLMEALMPLCPRPTPRVEIAANHMVTVAIGYVCGFLPWGFIALFDFISAKWRTVRNTRRLGYFHLGASVAPMVVVIAYAVLQALSGDYKEMMTAVIAVILTLHHVLRTLWGLVQLGQYATWCKHTLQCIRATHPKSAYEMWEPSDEDEDNNAIDLDEALMVNEDIVDNEFAGRDMSVSYSISERSMKVSNPEVCTIRWAAAFLCSLGQEWKSVDTIALPEELAFIMRSTLFHIDESQFGSPPVSFQYLSKALLAKGSNCGAFGAKISADVMCRWNPFESFQFEFDNIVSSYPTRNQSRGWSERNRIDARLEVVEFVLAARMLGHQKLQNIATQSSQRYAAFVYHFQFNDAFYLLQNQLGIEEAIYVSDVHWFWQLAMVPCLTVSSNAFTLQASIQVDNRIALNIGRFLAETGSMQLTRNEPTSLLVRSNSITQSLHFPAQHKFMLGTSLDLVRKVLAEWVLASADLCHETCWCPGLPKDSICFVLSDYLTSELKRAQKSFWDFDLVLAECQIAMQRNILELALETVQLPTSTEMIALLLLSHPAVQILITSYSNEVVEFTIKPMIAPQNLSLSMSASTGSGQATLKIVAENGETDFEWEMWINTAMQVMKSYNQTAKSERTRRGKNEFMGPLDLIKNVDLSRPMCTLDRNDNDEVLCELPGTLHVWTAWPMFDVHCCQFELQQWMDACDPIPDVHMDQLNADFEDLYRERKAVAAETLIKIASWNRA